MLIYWGACAASILLAWLGLHVKHSILHEDRHRRRIVFFSAIPLILVAALRYDVGRDYLYTYVPYFLRVQSGTVATPLEPLYHLINLIVASLHGGYPWVFAICAVLFMCMVYSQIFSDSPFPLLSIFLLIGMCYYFVFLNGMRQMVGCSILLFSLRYIQQKRFLAFLCCVVISSLFHYSCALFIFAYFVGTIRIKPKLIFLITVALLLISKPIVLLLNQLILQTSYASYINSVFDTDQRGWIVLGINLVITLFAAIFYRNHQKYQLYFNLQIIALWISALTGEIVLISRLRWFFGLPGIILIPLALANVNHKGLRFLLRLSIIILFIIYVTYTIGVKNGNTVLPYQTIFSK